MKGTVPFILAFAALPAPVVLALHFRDGPPARVTGGFGEDSCAACHSGQTVNDAQGRLTLTGLPERFEPGEAYDIELALSRPKMAVAGFELAIRDADTKAQAGRIAVPSGSGSPVGLLDERGVQFAHHLEPDVAGTAGDSVRWKLTWTAPAVHRPVIAHAAAVAGDGDDSQLGDYVYTLALMAEPAPEAGDSD